MKAIEEAFSSSGFRRVILPGIVLTAGVHPLLKIALPSVREMYGIDANVFIIFEVICLGLIVSSAIQWIYYVYEGFRFQWLTRWAGEHEHSVLSKLEAGLHAIQAGKSWSRLSGKERDRASKIYEELQDFPLEIKNDKPMRHAERPTRLGNVIAGYELYAESRYGIEDIQFWNHLLFLAPSDARKEVAEQYAFAESLVLTSFSGTIVTILHVTVLVVYILKTLNPALLLPHVPGSPVASVILCVAGLLIWRGFYKAAVLAHREVGIAMRTVVDLAFPSFIEWTEKMKTANANDDREWRGKFAAWLKDLRK